jgi:aspartyl/asparaginyl beta-hydroxylase (cupin superfamily)
LRALAAGDAARAVDLLRRATDSDPAAPPLWFNLATAARAANDDATEAAALDCALRLDPMMLPAFLAKAQLLERRGEVRAAVELYQRLLVSPPPAAQLPPAIAAAIDHGRALVAAQSGDLVERIDRALATPRAAVAPAERKRFDRAVDVMLGRARIWHNECAGLHYPFLPETEFFDRGFFPWLPDLEAATDAIRDELVALINDGEPGFIPYVDYPPETPPHQWAELNHSPRWSAKFLYKFGVPQADALARCPATAAAIARVPLITLPGRGPSVFFSLLRPRTRIPPHNGVSNTRATLHLPLILPPGCGFRVGSETRAWTLGEAWVFDDTIEHEAWNDSDQLRAILILDVFNPWLTATEQALLVDLFTAADAENPGYSPFAEG